jgi:hypothetical protein
VVVAAIFRGDRAQVRALMLAVEHNCSCELSPEGLISGNCPAHQALLDQRFLDGLLFASWLHMKSCHACCTGGGHTHVDP